MKLNRLDFIRRFTGKIMAIIGQYEPWMEFAATAAWTNYQEDPEDMTPEQHAEADIEEWRNNL